MIVKELSNLTHFSPIKVLAIIFLILKNCCLIPTLNPQLAVAILQLVATTAAINKNKIMAITKLHE